MRKLRGDDDSSADARKKKLKKLVRFSVDIVSAQQLPRPRDLGSSASLNPYIEFEMYSADDKALSNAIGEGGMDASARNGMSGIGSPLRKRTHIVERNGYDPIFNETISMSVETKYPSLVFVRWTVWNSPDGRALGSGPLATFAAKLSSLQQGYRHLPLFDSNGEQYLFSSLFCKIKKEESIAIEANMNICLRNGQASGPGSPAGETKGFFRRAFSRTNSERKKKEQNEQWKGYPFSRTSSVEK